MNFLVETSDNKNPPESTYGTRQSVFEPSDRENNGHISRNMRLALMMTEMVKPYIHFIDESDLISKSNTNTFETDKILLAHQFRWDVGGAFMVDETNLVWAEWPSDQFEGMSCHCFTQNYFRFGEMHAIDTTKLNLKVANSIKNSPTRWINQPDYTIKRRFLGQFSASLPVGNNGISIGDGNEIVVFARAVVDAVWGKESLSHAHPRVPPQTHFVQSRMNRSWYGKSDDGCHKVQGKRWFYSTPICISNGAQDSSGSKKQACSSFLNQFKVSQKEMLTKCPADGGFNLNDNNTILGLDQSLFIVLTVLIGFASLAIAFYCRYYRQYGCINSRAKLGAYVKSTSDDGYFDQHSNEMSEDGHLGISSPDAIVDEGDIELQDIESEEELEITDI